MIAQGELAAATTACEGMEAKIKREKEFGEKFPTFHRESLGSGKICFVRIWGSFHELKGFPGRI